MTYATGAAMRPLDLNAFALCVRFDNEKWWNDMQGEPIIRNKRQMLQLMLSEVSEAMEGERKSKPGALIMDDKLPHRRGPEVEMADVVIRLADWCGGFGVRLLDLSEAWGATRSDKPRMPWAKFNEHSDRGEMLFCISRSIVELDHYPAFNPNPESKLLYDVERYCEMCDYGLWSAVAEKLEFNRFRADHKLAHRAAEGGKTW